jgi:succinylglutamate desuccinylase
VFVTAEKDCNAETGFADIAGMKTKVGVNAVVDLHTAQAGSSVTATVH